MQKRRARYVSRNSEKNKNPIIVAVSGGFDPVHVGHIRLFQRAKKLGDKLVVILNNDNWLRKKKQHVFMPEQERKEIIEALRPVDGVILTRHTPNANDMSVCAELRRIRPNIFANGGDRHAGNIPEVDVCKEIGAKMVFNIGDGGKVQSSSWLLGRYLDAVNGRKSKKGRHNQKFHLPAGSSFM